MVGWGVWVEVKTGAGWESLQSVGLFCNCTVSLFVYNFSCVALGFTPDWS